jgi:hypothetical protein
MRQVIYILLVVNVVFFSWKMMRSLPHEQGENVARRMPAKVRQLETVQERAAKNATATDSARDAAGGEAANAAQQRYIREGESSVSGQDAAPRMDVASQPETADIRRVEALTAAEPPGAVGPPSKCRTLGPFGDARTMKAVEDRLNQLGYKPKERTGEARVEAGYWVYLPAMEREDALRITRMLDERNDHDFLIVKGNAVSLGAYDSRARADLRVVMLRKYGLDPVVEPRYAMRTGYWLDLDLPDDRHAILDTIRDEYKNAEVQESVCM